MQEVDNLFPQDLRGVRTVFETVRDFAAITGGDRISNLSVDRLVVLLGAIDNALPEMVELWLRVSPSVRQGVITILKASASPS